MIKNLNKLKNIIYNYYPKGVNFLDDKLDTNINYRNSTESINLTQLISNNIMQPCDEVEVIIESVKKINNIKLINNSRFSMGDRAYNFQYNGFFTQDKFYPICFVASILAPYYFYYIVDIDISFKNPIIPNGYKWKKNNGRNVKFESESKFEKIINIVSKEIETKLNYQKFPDEFVNKIIPDISYQDVEMGKMTYFNALFLSDFYCTG